MRKVPLVFSSTLLGFRNRKREFFGSGTWEMRSGHLAVYSRNRKCEAMLHLGGVEVWRGGLGSAYLLPTLSSVGASLAPPCCRFHTPLIEPDVRIYRIRLSEKTHAIAEAIACDAVCNF